MTEDYLPLFYLNSVRQKDKRTGIWMTINEVFILTTIRAARLVLVFIVWWITVKEFAQIIYFF